MKRSLPLFSLLVLGVLIGAATRTVHAQFGNSPEAQAAREKQLALEKTVPQLNVTEEHPRPQARSHRLPRALRRTR